MAIKIADNQGLYCESAVVDAFPFTMACLFMVRTLWANHPLMWVGDKDVPDYSVDMQARGGTAGDPLRLFVAKDGAANYASAQKGPYATETWQHGAGVLASTTSRWAYLEGEASDESTGLSASPTNWDRTSLGALLDSTPMFFNWQILAEVALWSRILGAQESAGLAAGHTPLFYLEDLVEYWPLGGLHGNHYRGIVGGNDLVEWLGSALEWVDHPPVIYQTGPQILRPLWEPLTYSTVRSEYVTTVTVTSDRPATVYFHWYVDGAFVASTRSPTRSFRVSQGEQLRIEVRATRNPDYDPQSDPPVGWPARRSLWWIRSTDSDLSYYRVEQKLGAGDWETLRIVPQVADQWAYSLLSDRLDDLSSYTWRVIPVDAAGNDGTAVTIGAELIVRTPDGPDFTATFDSGTTKVTFEET